MEEPDQILAYKKKTNRVGVIERPRSGWTSQILDFDQGHGNYICVYSTQNLGWSMADHKLESNEEDPGGMDSRFCLNKLGVAKLCLMWPGMH